MPVSQQKTKSITVTKLKSLEDCEISLGESLTAVMGTNCSGKTTVLHALACAYKPPATGGEDYRFPMFFRPSTDSRWTGSEYTVCYDERDGANVRQDKCQTFKKAADRWSPRQSRRPERQIKYLMVKHSVPEVEAVSGSGRIQYAKTPRNDALSTSIKQAAGQVLNRTYDEFNDLTYNRRDQRKSVGVKTAGISYSALAMSSGEQRIFRILEAVFSAANYGLILIDEIDLFLHQDALSRLLEKLRVHCVDKNKQLVFTTHFPPVANLYSDIKIVSLHRSTDRTLVWDGYSFDALQHITGQPQRPITVHVEDDVAQAIVGQIAADLGIRRRVASSRYGPAINAYTLGAGLILNQADLADQLIVLDGDVEATHQEKRKQINRVLTGDQAGHDEKRERLRKLVRKFVPSGRKAPEQVLHTCIGTINEAALPADDAEVVAQTKAIVNPADRHGFVDQVVEQIGSPRSVVVSKMVKLASTTPAWERYTRLVRVWLAKRKEALGL